MKTGQVKTVNGCYEVEKLKNAKIVEGSCGHVFEIKEGYEIRFSKSGLMVEIVRPNRTLAGRMRTNKALFKI